MTDLMYWHNFRTGEFDARPAPKTDDDALDYLPQIPAARGLYSVHRAMGETVMESMRLVLMACVGEEDD